MNIDYQLLDKQIQDLLDVRFGKDILTKQQEDSIDGIIELLETLQDEKE